MKTAWKVVKAPNTWGAYNILGASFNVTVITQATDLTLQDETNRLCDAYMMAASPALYDALEAELADLEEDRRWAETPDLARIIARCERIERVLALARGEAA